MAKRSVRPYVISTCAMVALLLLAEGILRISPYGGEEWDYPAGTYYVKDPHLFWRLKPGFYGEWRSVPVRINEIGMRAPAVTEWVDATEKILCMGDSVTFGFHVHGDLTYGSKLQHMLNEAGRECAVINAGVPGYTSFQLQEYLPEILTHEPQSLILSVGGFNEILQWHGQPDEEIDTGWVMSLGMFLEASRLYSFLGEKLHPVTSQSQMGQTGDPRSREEFKERIRSWHEEVRRVEPESYRRHLSAICEEARLAGVEVYLLVSPLNPYLEPGPPEEASDVLIDRYLAFGGLVHEGKLPQALTTLNALLSEAPETARLWFDKGQLDAQLGNAQDSAEAFRKAYALSPKRRRLDVYHQIVIDLAEAEAIPIVDTRPLFEERWFQPGDTETDLMIDYVHPSPWGHLLIAQALAAKLHGLSG